MSADCQCHTEWHSRLHTGSQRSRSLTPTRRPRLPPAAGRVTGSLGPASGLQLELEVGLRHSATLPVDSLTLTVTCSSKLKPELTVTFSVDRDPRSRFKINYLVTTGSTAQTRVSTKLSCPRLPFPPLSKSSLKKCFVEDTSHLSPSLIAP